MSAALAALTAGVLIKNPDLINMKKDYNERPMIQFWGNLIFSIEILAFVTLGILFNTEDFRKYAALGILFSVVVIISRIISVYVATYPLQFMSSEKTPLSIKERFFVASAGFKGITTGVLALLAYIRLVPIDRQLAEVILYGSLNLILISAIIQGLFLPLITRKTGVMDVMKT